jgi:hypothetical protein
MADLIIEEQQMKERQIYIDKKLGRK